MLAELSTSGRRARRMQSDSSPDRPVREALHARAERAPARVPALGSANAEMMDPTVSRKPPNDATRRPRARSARESQGAYPATRRTPYCQHQSPSDHLSADA